MCNFKCAFLILFFSTTTFAASSSARPDGVGLPLYIDIQTALGYSSVSGASLSDSPTLFQWQVGATAGLLMKKVFFLGFSADYKQLSQTSTVDATAGNYRGVRLNLFSPTLGFFYKKLLFKVDYQFIGDYKLSNNTPTGGTLTYAVPRGIRAALLYQLGGHWYFGALFEQITFDKQKNSLTGDRTLVPPLKLWQVGLNLGFVL